MLNSIILPDFSTLTGPVLRGKVKGSVYINFITEEETARISDTYGPNHGRLVQAKTKYDPNNLFRMNHNIKPMV